MFCVWCLCFVASAFYIDICIVVGCVCLILVCVACVVLLMC